MLGEHPVGVVLLTRDMAASRRFYAEALGLEVAEESESAITYRSGGTDLTVTSSTVGSKDEQTKASWKVRDLRAEPRPAGGARRAPRGVRHGRAADRRRHRGPRGRLVGVDHGSRRQLAGHRAAEVGRGAAAAVRAVAAVRAADAARTPDGRVGGLP
ncbi:VOC family protein [Clavibacter tessellarius]|uniref:VOC family protein n=1 Tax=Clavibacter tessellarius TaxID=31965 RepID=UPI003250B008